MKGISHHILAFLLLPLALYMQALPARQLPPVQQAHAAAEAKHSCCTEETEAMPCCTEEANDHAPSYPPEKHCDGPAGTHHGCPGGHCPMPCCHPVAVELWAHHWQAGQLGAIDVENGSLCPVWTNHVQKPDAPPPQV